MKRFIKILSAFILVGLLLYSVLICIVGELTPNLFKNNAKYQIGSGGHLYSRLHEVKKVRNIDILFLGSSHCYRGFDPRIFKTAGYTSFNLGSSAQTPIQTEVLLKQNIDQLNPKIVIFEVSPIVFSLDGVESSLNLLSNENLDLETLKMILRYKNFKIINTVIFKTYKNLFYKNSDFIEPLVKDSDTYISGGYVQKELQYFRHHDYKPTSYEFKESQFDALERILNIVRKREIRLILVQLPVTRSFYFSHLNHEVFDQKIKKYNEYYNFNELISLDDSLDFFDAHHLNQNGVEVFDRKLIQKLFSPSSISSRKE